MRGEAGVDCGLTIAERLAGLTVKVVWSSGGEMACQASASGTLP
jgi:hypothetical protein